MPKPTHQRAMIATAWFHPDDLRNFHRLRQRFFPENRNFLSAHATLFHYIKPHLRVPFVERAREVLDRQPAETPFVPVRLLPPFNMGKGVAYRLELEPLQRIRQPLRDAFAAELKEQDARPWRRPHITVQNKVEPESAKQLLRHLRRTYAPCTLRLLGIKCFRYDYGPWTPLFTIPLRSSLPK